MNICIVPSRSMRSLPQEQAAFSQSIDLPWVMTAR